jgi:hypothetical protein
MSSEISVTESLFRNSASTHNGWTRTNVDKKPHRTIRIGFQSNCNQDGLICDLTVEQKMKQVLNKYNVNEEKYKIENIHTKYEFSYALYIEEEEYQKLKDRMCETNKRNKEEIITSKTIVTV